MSHKKPTYADQIRSLNTEAMHLNATINNKVMRIAELESRLQEQKDNYAHIATMYNELMDAMHNERAAQTLRHERIGEERSLAIREKNDWETKAKLFEKQFFALSANSRSMLMSMVYGLDMVTSATTHHEKKVVIRHMKTCFGKLEQKEHVLSLENEPDLPF